MTVNDSSALQIERKYLRTLSTMPWGSRLVDLTAITVMLVGSAFLVNPLGDFPLNDDWAYALTVKQLLDTGEFRPMGAPTAQILTNVLWGALFSIPGGFSFTALRLSTLFASLLGLFGCYIFARSLSASRYAALVAVLTLAANPIYCELSYTFMTDVLFLSLLVWSTVFFHKSLLTRSRGMLLIGTLLAIAATLSREIGICVPLGFALACLLDNRRKGGAHLAIWIPFCACGASLVIYKLWLVAIASTSKDTNSLATLELLGHPIDMMRNVLNHTFVTGIYLGLFLIPVLLLGVKPWSMVTKREMTIVGISAAIFLVGATAHTGVFPPAISDVLMPVGYNLLTPAGLGPDVLRDTDILRINQRPSFPTSFWITVTATGLVGTYLLTLALIREARRDSAPVGAVVPVGRNTPATRFALLCGALYLVPLILCPVSFDQYLPPAVFFFATHLSPNASNSAESRHTLIHRALIPLTLTAFAIFSIACSHDYLMLNRVRWNALHELQTERGVSAREIDGGFEFNGWYLYSDTYERKPDLSEWWVYGDSYIVALGDVPGYTRVRTYTYLNWLPRHRQQVVILSRSAH